MKNILININVNLQALLKSTQHQNAKTNKSTVECNYSDNYYGDQQCQPMKIK